MALSGQDINNATFAYVTVAFAAGRGPNLLGTLESGITNADYPGGKGQVHDELITDFEAESGETRDSFYEEAADSSMVYMQALLQAQLGISDVGALLPDVDSVEKSTLGVMVGDIQPSTGARVEIFTTGGVSQGAAITYDFKVMYGATQHGPTLEVPKSKSKDLALLFWEAMDL